MMNENTSPKPGMPAPLVGQPKPSAWLIRPGLSIRLDAFVFDRSRF